MTKDDDKRKAEADHKDSAVKPEPETLHTPDPQKKMEGPISSLIQGTKKTFDSSQTKEEADEEKEKDM